MATSELSEMFSPNNLAIIKETVHSLLVSVLGGSSNQTVHLVKRNKYLNLGDFQVILPNLKKTEAKRSKSKTPPTHSTGDFESGPGNPPNTKVGLQPSDNLQSISSGKSVNNELQV